MKRWTRYSVMVLSLVTAASLSACGDDEADGGTGPVTGDELSATESQALVEVVLGAAFLGGASFSNAPGGDFQAGSALEPFEYSGPCQEGGTLSMTGNVTDNTDEFGNGSASFDVTLVHTNCGARAQSNGMLFTLNGNPNVGMDFQITSTETTFSYDGSINGNVRWTSGSRSGTCPIDIQWEYNATENSFSGSQSGSACGKNQNVTF